MPRHCTVCDHPQRGEIDRSLVEGDSKRTIANHFSLSDAAVQRHKSHLNGALARAKEAEEATQADNLLDQVKDLQKKALNILAQAEEAEDWRTALGAIREARGNLELLAKLLGELKDHPQINILIAPEWITLRTMILEALEPYPDARISVSKALKSLTNGVSNGTNSQ